MGLPLVQCPWCEHNDWDIKSFDIEDREGFPTSATCTNCGAVSPWGYSKKQDDFDAKLFTLISNKPTENRLRKWLGDANTTLINIQSCLSNYMELTCAPPQEIKNV